MCKQLNGPVLKSLKLSGSKLEKNWPCLAQAKSLSFDSGRALVKILISLLRRAGPGHGKFDPCRPLDHTPLYHQSLPGSVKIHNPPMYRPRSIFSVR